jgi:psiF repeat
MKITAALAAVAVLGCGAVFAADPPSTTTTRATPSAARATPVKSLKACNKQADAKSLTGAQRSAFVKNCRGPKGAAPP